MLSSTSGLVSHVHSGTPEGPKSNTNTRRLSNVCSRNQFWHSYAQYWASHTCQILPDVYISTGHPVLRAWSDRKGILTCVGQIAPFA